MKITKIIIILILLINTSCGYKPIYLKDDKLFLEFDKIILIGDERINKQIINIVGLKENESNSLENELTLKTNFNIKETSKNSKGQIQTYRSTISVQLIIKKNEKIINSKYFLNEFSYTLCLFQTTAY